MLDSSHARQLAQSALTESTIQQRGYATLSQRERLRECGFSPAQQRRIPGLLLPLWNVRGEQQGWQYRPDTPRQTKEGRILKYETPYGMRMMLDIHPSMVRKLDNPREELWITEGIKKGDALATLGIACVALLGVWNWRGRNSYEGLKTLADWDFIALNGRHVYVAFDNDVMAKPEVALALHRLTGMLTFRKATVHIVYLPQRPDKLGLDDFLAEGHAFEELQALATFDLPPKPEPDDPLTTLLRIMDSAEIIRTSAHEWYGICRVNGHDECLDILERGGGFKSWLVHKFQEDDAQNKPPPAQALARAMDAAFAIARFETEDPANVWTRMGWKDDRVLYVDLGAPSYRSVQVTAQGWIIAPHPLVHFRRPKGQLPLPEPLRDGDIRALRPFLNVAPESDDERLIWGWLLSCYLPGGPYAHLCLHGPQGSAKSTATRLLRSLIDPHEVPARLMPKDIESLMLQAQNSAVVCLENLSGMPLWLSDALCVLATGGGLSRRGLYTEEEHYVFGKRPAILNGIVEVATRGDLRDRCILVTLERIEDETRRAERDFWLAWEEARPAILGALYDAAALAFVEWQTIDTPSLPRMADMAKWIMAGCSSFFVSPKDWLAAYRNNQRMAAAIEVEASPLASLLLEFLDLHTVKQSSLGVLLQDMRRWLIQTDRTIPPNFPETADGFGRQLRRIEILLQESGWHFIQSRNNHAREYTFTRR